MRVASAVCRRQLMIVQLDVCVVVFRRLRRGLVGCSSGNNWLVFLLFELTYVVVSGGWLANGGVGSGNRRRVSS